MNPQLCRHAATLHMHAKTHAHTQPNLLRAEGALEGTIKSLSTIAGLTVTGARSVPATWRRAKKSTRQCQYNNNTATKTTTTTTTTEIKKKSHRQ